MFSPGCIFRLYTLINRSMIGIDCVGTRLPIAIGVSRAHTTWRVGSGYPNSQAMVSWDLVHPNSPRDVGWSKALSNTRGWRGALQPQVSGVGSLTPERSETGGSIIQARDVRCGEPDITSLPQVGSGSPDPTCISPAYRSGKLALSKDRPSPVLTGRVSQHEWVRLDLIAG